MRFQKLFQAGAILLAASVITFTACKRSSDTSSSTALTNADDNGGYASDNAKLEQNNNDVISIADASAQPSGASNLRTTATYPTVTLTDAGTDTVMTIDFGPTDHLCLDGRERKGQIIVTYSGRYKDSGSVHTITTNNYYVNDQQVIAHKSVQNMGANSHGQIWYNVTVNDSIVLATDSVISWTGNRTRTWDSGYATATRLDDVYLIGGTTTLKRANGHVFTFTISATDPLKVAIVCPWIEAGTVTVSSTVFTTGDRTVNYTYGGGGCDDLAQLTIGSTTYDITLH